MKITTRKIIITAVILLAIIAVIMKINNNSNNINKKKFKSFESRIEEVQKISDTGEMIYGWVKVEGTNIDVPIFAASYEEEEGESAISYSWLDPKYSSEQRKIKIIGHNVLNVSSKPMLNNNDLSDFEDLMSFVYYDHAKENQFIQITLNGKNYLYQIYAIQFHDEFNEELYTEEDAKEYISESKKNSIYDYSTKVDEKDELLTLETCTRFFGIEDKTLFRIEAKKINENDKIEYSSIKKSKNYEEISNKLYEENSLQ